MITLFNSLTALMLWVSQVSGLAMPPGNKLPEITFGEMVPDICGKTNYLGQEWHGKIVFNQHMFNTYDRISQTCTIAHEVTHYLQEVNKVDMSWPEPQAYSVQAQCLHMFGGHDREAKWAEQMASQKDPYHQTSCTKLTSKLEN